MNAAHYVTRRHYHLRWMAKYSLASVACFIGSLAAWPRTGGLVLLFVGYVCAWLSGRERRRAFKVLP